MNEDLERQLRELSERMGREHHGLPEFDGVARKRARVRQAIAAIAATAVLFGAVAGGYGIVSAFRKDSAPTRIVSSNVIVAAAASTEAAGSARMTFEGEISMTGSTDLSADFTGDGIFDFAQRTGQMTMDGPMGSDTEAIWKDGVSYTSVSIPGSETKWIKKDAEEAMSMGIDPLGSDAGSMLASLEGISSRVEMVGSDDVRGVSTSHYRAEIDPDALLSALEEQEENLEYFGSIDVESFPVEVWVDEQGLIRRMSFAFEASGGGDVAQFSMSMTMTMELFDFGVAVDVQVPPDEDIVTEEEFREQMGFSSDEP